MPSRPRGELGEGAAVSLRFPDGGDQTCDWNGPKFQT